MARGSAQELSPVCAYVAARTGTSLSVQQVARLKEALASQLGGMSEEAYVERLRTAAGAAELAALMAAVSVHKTELFRDEVQLAAFQRHVLEPLAARERRPLHVWSAGCATGEEVATLLILLAEAGAHPGSSVLGTDIAEGALAQARRLTFPEAVLKRVPPDLRERYFQREGDTSSLAPALKARASFVRHNLMDTPYPRAADGGDFDLIVCRNVLIYFTEAAFAQVVHGLAERLRTGGTLVLSSAEPLLKPHPRLETQRCDQAFFYVKRAPDAVGPKAAAAAVPPKPRASREIAALPAAPPPAAKPEPTRPAPAAAPEPAPAPSVEADDPLAEARRTFDQVLEWANAGDEEPRAEQGLRKCLYLDPHFPQARYLLGTLLEKRGQKADAASEYRRALSALNDGRSRPVAFFLNDERLKTACASALKRLGYP